MSQVADMEQKEATRACEGPLQQMAAEAHQAYVGCVVKTPTSHPSSHCGFAPSRLPPNEGSEPTVSRDSSRSIGDLLYRDEGTIAVKDVEKKGRLQLAVANTVGAGRGGLLRLGCHACPLWE